MKEEVFKPIKGYEGSYEISNLGRVKSLSRMVKGKGGGLRRVPERIMSVRTGGREYLHATLCLNSKYKTRTVHGLVAEAFLDADPSRPQVNHINGDKFDNRVENLEWVTQSENMLHSYKMGLHKRKVGSEVPGAKLTEREVGIIRKLHNTKKLFHREIGEAFGVSKSTIKGIINNKYWNHVK